MREASDIKLLIIADDLTGANDAGAQFAKCGIRSIVVANPELDQLPHEFPVVVINTESRHVSPEEAARRVAHVAKLGVAAEVPHFFKKTDSTLRGNIGSELRALLEATDEPSIVFVPAFPEMGRTTREGIHYVDGVPIAETAFANDPLNPVRTSAILKVLRASAELTVIHAQSERFAGRGRANCIVMDCEDRKELRSIAEACHRHKVDRVLAGSAAFAEELPQILPFTRGRANPIKPRGPILLVSGSLNPRSLEQVDRMRNSFSLIQLTPEAVFNTAAISDLEQGANVLIYSILRRDEYLEFRRQAVACGITEGELHPRVAEANGRLVKLLMEKAKFQTLVVFGGDTLTGISRVMNWHAFVSRGELESGLTAANPCDCDVLVISKAGGFGDRDVVRRILDIVAS
jgi:uncharacterized protein YgbK (DUF1537 family)